MNTVAPGKTQSRPKEKRAYRASHAVKSFYMREYAPTGRRFVDFLLRNRFELTLYFLFALINLLIALGMQYPILTDEHVTIAEGVYLWGDVDHWASAYEGANYYGYGYSVLYGWIYNLTHNMQQVYAWSLVFNSVLISLIPVLAFRVCKTYLRRKPFTAFWLGLMIGLYPAIAVYTKYALNEPVMLIVPWLAISILLYLYTHPEGMSKQLALYALLGFLCMYAYTVHGRGAAILGTCALFVLFLLIKNRKPKYILFALVFLAAAGAWYMIDSMVKSHLLQNLFQVSASNAGNSIERVLSVNMAGAFSLQNLPKLLGGFFGQSFYMMCATFGLLAFGVVALFSTLRRLRKPQDGACKNLNVIVIFTTLFALASIAISTMFLSGIYTTDELFRAEYYLYGRYNEAACMMIVFEVAAFLLLHKKLSRGFRVASLVLFLATVAGGAYYVGTNVVAAGGSLSYSMIPGVMPFMGYGAWGGAQYGNFAALAVCMVGIFIALWLFLTKSRHRQAFVLLVLCFIYSITYSMCAFLYPVSAKRFDYIQPLEKIANETADLAEQYPNVYIDFFSAPLLGPQFAMSRYAVHYLELNENGYGKLAEMEKNSFIVSLNVEPFRELYNKDLYELKTQSNVHIWIYGKELFEEMRDRGYTIRRQKAEQFEEYTAVQDPVLENAILLMDGLCSTEGSSIVLQPGGTQYGPYIKTVPGTYTVDIYGENLMDAVYTLKSGGGDVEYPVGEFEVFTPEHVAYRFTTSGFGKKVEFCTVNAGLGEVTVDKISLNLDSIMEYKKIKDAQVVADMHRDYDMHRSQMYRSDNFTFNKQCVKGQTGLLMRAGGSMELGGLFFNPGSHQVAVYGTNIAGMAFDLTAEFDCEISDIRTYDDSIVFTLTTDEYVKEGRLSVRNDSQTAGTFRGVRINALHLRDVPGLTWQRAK